MLDAADRKRKLTHSSLNRRRKPILYRSRAAVRGLLRNWRPVGCLAVVLAVATLTVLSAGRLAVFEIKHVMINQCGHVSEKELLDLILLPRHQNIFLADLDLVRSRLESHPWISRALVRRQLPSSLIVRLEEHEPAAIIHLDAFYFLDAQGRVFKRVASTDAADFPVITGLGRADLLNGENTDGLLPRALKLAQAASGTAVFGGVSEVRIGPLGDMSLVTERDGLQVRIGSGEFDRKVRNLETLLGRLGGLVKQVASIDMGHNDRAVVRLISTGGSKG